MKIRNIYDISIQMQQGMVTWPDDPDFTRKPAYSINEGSDCNVSIITMGSHTGTHIDAPLHFYAGGMSVEQMPLDCFIGPAKVIELTSAGKIEPIHLIDKGIREGERILFKTRNSSAAKDKGFLKDYVFLSPDAARFLAEINVKLTGFDYLSVDDFQNEDCPSHKILLSVGIPILEGIDLSVVPEGTYFLSALPLKLPGSDASPVRAVLLDEYK